MSHLSAYLRKSPAIDWKRRRSSSRRAFFTHFVVFRYLLMSTLPASVPWPWVL